MRYVHCVLHVKKKKKRNLCLTVANICITTLQKEPFEISVHCVSPYSDHVVSQLPHCVSTDTTSTSDYVTEF